MGGFLVSFTPVRQPELRIDFMETGAVMRTVIGEVSHGWNSCFYFHIY